MIDGHQKKKQLIELATAILPAIKNGTDHYLSILQAAGIRYREMPTDKSVGAAVDCAIEHGVLSKFLEVLQSRFSSNEDLRSFQDPATIAAIEESSTISPSGAGPETTHQQAKRLLRIIDNATESGDDVVAAVTRELERIKGKTRSPATAAKAETRRPSFSIP